MDWGGGGRRGSDVRRVRVGEGDGLSEELGVCEGGGGDGVWVRAGFGWGCAARERKGLVC